MTAPIAIIGAGPAGCALACFLCERNIDTLVFDDHKKPALLVGESLVPAAMPIIRRLGIEQQLADISQVKRGAALRHTVHPQRVDFAFRNLANNVPDYAYNIPRPQFDQLLRDRAQELGVQFIDKAAQVETSNSPERDLQLSDQSLADAGLGRANQPRLLIDATGRSRLFSRILKIPATRGSRNDVAHFAHFSNFPSDSELDGQIVITVLECGWSWQIPLPNATSVGVVMDAQAAKQYGKTAEERLENVMQQNVVLNKPHRQRVSEVKTYANYQLISQQAHGKGWALLGDALGFVDPMLSPGVFMALESASLMDKLVFAKPVNNRQAALDAYFHEIKRWHRAWSQLIDYFYDGRMLTLSSKRPEVPADQSRFAFSKLPDMAVSAVLARLVSGAGTRSKINHAMLKSICGVACRDSAELSNYQINA